MRLKTFEMIARRHTEGRLFPHDRVGIWLRRRPRPFAVVAIVCALPLTVGDGGYTGGLHPTCGTPVGAGPHPAWFRCTRERVERQYISDFPMLVYLSTVSTDYANASIRGDDATIRQFETELEDMLQHE